MIEQANLGVSATASRGDALRENLEWNHRRWDKGHPWPQDGDEWAGQAAACGVPYPTWKESLVRRLIAANLTPEMHALEIAPGHGRWTEHLINYAGHVTVVDLSASCLSYCCDRFRDRSNIDYVLTPGDRLPLMAEGKIDFVWSFDSFVHMHPDVIAAYLGEIRRVLKPGGKALIHHADIGDVGGHKPDAHPGWRSAVNAALVRELAERAGLAVVAQFTYWDPDEKIGVPRFGDLITELRPDTGGGQSHEAL